MLQIAAGTVGPARLLAAAMAGGLNLYLTVTLLGAGSRLGWITLPVGLRGLENSVLLASAIVLLAIEVTADKLRYVDSVWHAAHTIIRPLGTALLAWLALEGWPTTVRFAGAGIALLAALAAHAAKAGLRVIANLSDRRWNTRISLAEDALALLLLAVVIAQPRAAPVAVGIAFALLAVFGPRLWRAAGLGIRAAIARFRGFFGQPGWREPAAMPRRFRALAPHDPLGIRPARVARAATNRLPGALSWRSGWLLLDGSTARFLSDARFGARSVDLPPIDSAEVLPGLLTDAIRCVTSGRDFTVYLFKDGPAPGLIADALVPTNR